MTNQKWDEKAVYDLLANLIEKMRQDRIGSGAAIDLRPDFPLLARHGIIDSLSVIYFLGAIEDYVNENCGKKIDLISTQALTDPQKPYGTVGSLVQCLISKLNKSVHPA